MLLMKELSKSEKIVYLISSVVLFSGLYYLCDVISNYKIESPFDYLYFSLITQTTVGYDNLNHKFTQKYKNAYTDDNKLRLFDVINAIQLVSIFFLL